MQYPAAPSYAQSMELYPTPQQLCRGAQLTPSFFPKNKTPSLSNPLPTHTPVPSGQKYPAGHIACTPCSLAMVAGWAGVALDSMSIVDVGVVPAWDGVSHAPWAVVTNRTEGSVGFLLDGAWWTVVTWRRGMKVKGQQLVIFENYLEIHGLIQNICQGSVECLQQAID